MSNTQISIAVEVSQARISSLYSLYHSLKRDIPEEELFLFESLSGPTEKRKFSLLGALKLFEIAFYGNKVCIIGESGPLELLAQYLDQNDKNSQKQAFNFQHFIHDLTLDTDTLTFQLNHPDHFWTIIKHLQSIFKINANKKDLPLYGTGFMSTFGYDFAWKIEDLPQKITAINPEPDATFALFQSVIFVNNETGKAYHTSNFLPCEHSVLPPLESLNLMPETAQHFETLSYKAKDTIEKAEYLNWVNNALAHIRAGDIYQVQLGHEIIIDTETSVSTVYENLRQQNPSPYMFLASVANQMIIGASPEIHLRKEGSKITMRPIAGTVKRGKTPTEDAALVKQLQNDPKECAEHLMLIDLCRNDLGRVCKTGSLTVDKMMVVEQYSHVSHLVSNTTATLKTEYDFYDAMRATFPAGTLTGAPKVRAMEIIEATEKSRRGYYAGAIGFIDFKGEAQVALMIRMGTHTNNQFRIRASAGIVIDSIPEREWQETLGKLSAMYKAITNKELRNENFTH